jgi:hypothetical protein
MSEAQETGEQGDAPLLLPALTPLSAPPPPLASNGSLAPAPATSDATAAFNFDPTTPGGGIDFTNFLGQYSQSNNGPKAMYGGSSYPPFAPTASSSSATAPAPAQLARDSQSPNLSVSPKLAQEALVPSPSTAPKKATKKRKSNAGKGAGTEDEDDDEAKKKRIKTPRACDSCRRKKIRYAGDISAARGGGRQRGSFFVRSVAAWGNAEGALHGAFKSFQDCSYALPLPARRALRLLEPFALVVASAER